MATATHPIPELQDIARNVAPARRAAAIRQISELFVQSAELFGADHIALFDGILLGLLPQTEVAAPDVAAPPADGAVDLATAPPEGSVTIPTGAGVTAETRDGKPVVKVYFDTGKTDVVDAFGATAGGLKTWLASHAGSWWFHALVIAPVAIAGALLAHAVVERPCLAWVRRQRTRAA